MDGTNIPPENQNPHQDNLDKTIDESAFSDPAQFQQQMQQAPQRAPGAANPYQQQQLPDGSQPIPIGSGTIVSVLGTGGMARVYKIWNEKLEVYRAVKVLLPGGQQTELSSRFETEAKITAKLHHPNIVEIYNVGEWSGLPYLEMELIEGTALDTIISNYGRLPDAVCSAIGMQIAQALAYAHSQEFLIYGKTYKGIIHRDLKPANIMIANQGELKLMDFGIARPTEAGLHTMDGHIVGTLQYLSPEQLDGVEIDKRSDIYSFGTILYEALTGAKTFPQGTITNLMKMKATNSYRKFNELGFQTNAMLAKITEKCLLIDRNERYPDASDLYKDIRKVHISLTSDSAREVLRGYIQEPATYSVVHKARKRIPKKVLVTSGIVLGLIGIIVMLMTLFPLDITEQAAKESGVVKTAKLTPVPEPEQKPVPETTKTASQVIPEKKPTREETAKQQPVARTEPKKNYKESPRRKPAPKPKTLSPTEKLKQEYGKQDLLAIGVSACQKGKYSDAVTALEAVPGSDQKKSLYLLWAYVEMKKYAKARSISPSLQSNDAFVELLKGRIEAGSNKGRVALNHFEAALTKPSAIKDRVTIRNDALYYTALVHDSHYRHSPSSETRMQALTAWNNLKRVYSATPNHPRFKLANKKLAESY